MWEDMRPFRTNRNTIAKDISGTDRRMGMRKGGSEIKTPVARASTEYGHSTNNEKGHVVEYGEVYR